ncbi:MAG: family 16 glycosylhydrolase [Deltaproteobacteria bacterium]|nr:family 16 glycosylhydrolase [Deltaproteobacteria bacterium]
MLLAGLVGIGAACGSATPDGDVGSTATTSPDASTSAIEEPSIQRSGDGTDCPGGEAGPSSLVQMKDRALQLAHESGHDMTPEEVAQTEAGLAKLGDYVTVTFGYEACITWEHAQAAGQGMEVGTPVLPPILPLPEPQDPALVPPSGNGTDCANGMTGPFGLTYLVEKAQPFLHEMTVAEIEVAVQSVGQYVTTSFGYEACITSEHLSSAVQANSTVADSAGPGPGHGLLTGLLPGVSDLAGPTILSSGDGTNCTNAPGGPYSLAYMIAAAQESQPSKPLSQIQAGMQKIGKYVTVHFGYEACITQPHAQAADKAINSPMPPPMPPPTHEIGPRLWRLTWSDEFNGPEVGNEDCYHVVKTPAQCIKIDNSTADCCSGNPDGSPDCLGLPIELLGLNKCVWSVLDLAGRAGPDGLIAAASPDAVAVEGGELILKTHVNPWYTGQSDCGNPVATNPKANTKNCPFHVGGVNSQTIPALAPAHGVSGFSQQYGRFEVRAKLAAGPGNVSAHWLMPQAGTPWRYFDEIDIMEQWATYQTSVHGGLVSGWALGNRQIGPWQMAGTDRYLAGDFVNGDGQDELLFLSEVFNAGGLMEFNGSAWQSVWSGPFVAMGVPGYLAVGFDNYALNKYVTGDFDGDGMDELLAINNSDEARLLRYVGGSWQAPWIDPNWQIGPWWGASSYRFVAGDFNGDGQDELLAVWPVGLATLLKFDGATWQVVWSTVNGQIGPSWTIGPMDQYLAGRFDGAGPAVGLMVVNPNALPPYVGVGLMKYDPAGNTWTPQWWTADRLIGPWSVNPGDRFVTGDFDGDQQEEVLAVSDCGWAQVVEYAPGTGWQWVWDNGGDGHLMTDAPWYLRQTDAYVAGYFTGAGKAQSSLLGVSKETGLWQLLGLQSGAGDWASLAMNQGNGDITVSETGGFDPLNNAFSTEYHLFAAEWDQYRIYYYIDGIKYREIQKGEIGDGKVHDVNGNTIGQLPLNLGIPKWPFHWMLSNGLKNYVVPVDNFFWELGHALFPDVFSEVNPNPQDFIPQEQHIDYVRVYERCQVGTDCKQIENQRAWERKWGNQNNLGYIGPWDIDPTNDRYVVGNFDSADPEDELLAIEVNFGLPLSDAQLLRYQNGSWQGKWDNGGSGFVGNWLPQDIDQFVAGDFDGDGADELLAIRKWGPNGMDALISLQKYDAGSWQPLFSGASYNVESYPLYVDTQYIVIDSNGDGRDELFVIHPSAKKAYLIWFGGPPGWFTMWCSDSTLVGCQASFG